MTRILFPSRPGSILGAAAALALLAAPALHSRAAESAPAEKATSITELLGQLKGSSHAVKDPALDSLGGDLARKTQSLAKSLGGNTDATSQLQAALKSLLGGSGADSLGSLQKLSALQLTPEQNNLVKDVRDVGGAYLVQKNLGTLEGAQGDVAKVVNALRQGRPTEALPSVQRIGQNAKLTEAQKGFLSSLTGQLTPGGKAAGDVLKAIPGLGK